MSDYGSWENSTDSSNYNWHIASQPYIAPIYYTGSLGQAAFQQAFNDYARLYQWTVTVNSPKILNKNIKVL